MPTPPVPPSFSGLFLLDKPSGPTSHDAVAWARRALGIRRVGHCGTLDPLASGLLLLGIGDALRLQDRFTALRKTYRGRLRLGLTTDTDDISGKPLREADASGVDEALLRAAVAKFQGPLQQRVPLYSAVKVGGRRLYEMARAGVAVEPPVKTVEVYRFEVLGCALPEADFLVESSKGTYVRALVRDVGEGLGTGAAMVSLVREAVGPFARAGAYRWDGGRSADAEAFSRALIPRDGLERLLKAAS